LKGRVRVAIEDVNDRHIVSGEWLEEHLDDQDLRIVDATVVLDPESWHANTGRSTWEESHIPGAIFVDLIEELSDPAGDEGLPEGVRAYRLPSAEAFAEAIGRHGIGNETAVVVYDTTAGMWASRLWWMLRVFGHDRVAVLDGGWAKWEADGRPVTSDVGEAPEPTVFEPTFRSELVATKDEVSGSVEDADVVLVNALWPELFRGEAKTPLDRPGRIPGSVNVPFTEVAHEDGTLKSAEEVREIFSQVGADGRSVVTYCGGGIAATFDALALATAGIDAAVYDGSLVEWVADPELPLETG
jgi:thiosulfate/3-mercaptopyruvate sulfurtransferase